MSVGFLCGKYRFAKATFTPIQNFEKMKHVDASAYIPSGQVTPASNRTFPEPLQDKNMN